MNNNTYQELLLLAISIAESPEADSDDINELNSDLETLLNELPPEDAEFIGTALKKMINNINR